MDEFVEYLIRENLSQNTINGYISDIHDYLKWFQDAFSKENILLLKQNILQYKYYLQNTKRNNAKTINHKLSSLRKYNAFLISKGVQNEMVIDKNDMMKIQQQYASPTNISEMEVKQFLQTVLETKNTRNYAIMVLLAYAGLRISEALNIQLDDFNLTAGECIIRNGKGDKQRIVILNSKIINALKEYLKIRSSYPLMEKTNYLFISHKNGRLDRTTVNKIFNQLSDKITPHQLRHFFCTNALEKDFSIHEVAYQAGHSNIHTTLLYTNPDKRKLKTKMESL